MKTPSDNLYRLVHSMTAAEKRYFKRHYSSGKNMLTDLFNYLNTLTKYDEEVVKEHFTGSKLVKNLKVYKVQLSKLLLKSLASYNYKNNVRSRIRFGLEEVQILMDKQLYDMARDKIKKLKQICKENEEYDYLMSVLKLEGQFHTFYNISPGATIEYLIEELEEVKDQICTQVYLQKTSSLLINYINSGKGIELFENFTKTLHNVESMEPRGFTEQHFRLQTIGYLYALKGDYKKELYYKKAGVQLHNEHKEQIPNRVNLFFSAIHNYLAACNAHQKFNDFDEQFAQINQLIQEYPKLDRNFIFIIYLKLRSLFQQDKFGLVSTKLETKALETASRYEMESPLILSSTYLHLAIARIYQGNFEKALYLLRELNVHKSKNPAIIQQAGWSLELICHYETNAKSILNNFIQSLKRRDKKKKEFTPFFKEMLSLFLDLLRTPAQEKQAKFQAFHNQMELYEKDSLLIAFKSLRLDYWLLSKIKNASVQQIINEKKKINATV